MQDLLRQPTRRAVQVFSGSDLEMPKQDGRKTRTRQYAQDHGISYTTALRHIEHVEALFSQFKIAWQEVAGFPIRLDGDEVLISTTPDSREWVGVDWDKMEATHDYREAVHGVLATHPHWASEATPLPGWAPKVTPPPEPTAERELGAHP